MPFHPNHLIIFTKAPIKGKVKTRLAIAVGEEQALGLYKNFVADIILSMTSGSLERYHIDIAFYPSDSKQMVKNWIGHKG